MPAQLLHVIHWAEEANLEMTASRSRNSLAKSSHPDQSGTTCGSTYVQFRRLDPLITG